LCRRVENSGYPQRPPQTVVHPAYALLTSASTRPSTDLEPARQPLTQEVQVHLASAAGQSDAAAFLARPHSPCRIFSSHRFQAHPLRRLGQPLRLEPLQSCAEVCFEGAGRRGGREGIPFGGRRPSRLRACRPLSSSSLPLLCSRAIQLECLTSLYISSSSLSTCSSTRRSHHAEKI
jgi:hypothetical protein